MALTINTNVASLNAQRNLGVSQSALQQSMQRLSSGLRINSAKDDAAGLAISDRMTAQIRGMNQAARNANDGISMAQTAEGSMQEITNMLQRMRELAVQGANSATYGTGDMKSINEEIGQNSSEIARIIGVTQFNGRNVLADTSGSWTFQVGANTSSNDVITVAAMNIAGDASVTAVSGQTFGASSNADYSGVMNKIDAALSVIDQKRGTLGAIQNRFESTVSNLNNVVENLSASRSRIQDSDIASETSEMTKQNILQQAGVSILAQANQTPQLALSLLG
jgi:flagellin